MCTLVQLLHVYCKMNDCIKQEYNYDLHMKKKYPLLTLCVKPHFMTYTLLFIRAGTDPVFYYPDICTRIIAVKNS